MNKKILNLFEDFKLLQKQQHPVMVGKLPDEIFVELIYFLKCCNDIKSNRLSFLREHYNAGKNTYQLTIPPNLVDNSYLLAFLNYLGEYFIHSVTQIPLEEMRRKVILLRNRGHFDGYHLWFNYANEGDENLIHHHSGDLSGVIYIKNTYSESTKFEDGFEYRGNSSDIIIFPAFYRHYVEKKLTKGERITVSFNMKFLKDDELES